MTDELNYVECIQVIIVVMCLAACWASQVPTPKLSTEVPLAGAQRLIGGFDIDESELSGVGAVVIQYAGPSDIRKRRPDLLCTGTLVHPQVVLTAKHCVRSLEKHRAAGYEAFFVRGADAYEHSSAVKVAAGEVLSPDVGGFNHLGRDVGLLHLVAAINTAPSLPLAELQPIDLGRSMVAIGYGAYDYNDKRGRRRVGKVTLKATGGRTYEALAGSFLEYFRLLYKGADPSSCTSRNQVLSRTDLPGIDDQDDPEPQDESFDVRVCELLERERRNYEAVRLETMEEVVAGGRLGEAQACAGDSGGPLIGRDASGRLAVYGVVSGTIRDVPCIGGAVYARVDRAVVDFLKRASRWVDPCEPALRAPCSGAVAQRCSTWAEGPRRLLQVDCSLLGLVCGPGRAGVSACIQRPTEPSRTRALFTP